MKRGVVFGLIVLGILVVLIILPSLISPSNIPFCCTQEAKICPDGTSVGRGGWFCSFEKCPKLENYAKEGEKFSAVYDEYPEHCQEGLIEWSSGMDTRISIADECYMTFALSGLPVGICINCGNGICEDIEGVCNCPEDCVGQGKSNYLNAEEFCNSTRGQNLVENCEEEFAMQDPLCNLC